MPFGEEKEIEIRRGTCECQRRPPNGIPPRSAFCPHFARSADDAERAPKRLPNPHIFQFYITQETVILIYMRKYICCCACALVSALSYGARVEIESPSGKSEFDCEIEKVSEKLSRLTVPKDSIPRDAKTVFVSIDLARGCRGEEGYIALPRGGIVDFDFPDGEAVYGFMEMPIFGAKTPRGTFWAQVRGMRNEAELMLRAKGGKIEPVLRFRTDSTPNGAYEDIVVDFNFLDKGAGYVEMGKAYRLSRLSAGEVKPIKERIKPPPEPRIRRKGGSRAHTIPRGEKTREQGFHPRKRTPDKSPPRLQKINRICGRLQKGGNRGSRVLLGRLAERRLRRALPRPLPRARRIRRRKGPEGIYSPREKNRVHDPHAHKFDRLLHVLPHVERRRDCCKEPRRNSAARQLLVRRKGVQPLRQARVRKLPSGAARKSGGSRL